MGQLRNITVKGTNILVIDYSNSTEKEMIELLLQAKELILSANRSQAILSIYHNTFVTPGFMNRVRLEVPHLQHLIYKQALIGLNEPKRWILKGLNLFLNTDFRSFDTEEEALEFLTDKS